MLVNVLIFLILFLCILFIVILSYVLYKNKHARNEENWQTYISYLISQALFDTEADELVMKSVSKLVRNKHFRSCLINEIIQTKKNLSGNAGILLKDLYEFYELNLDSAEKLTSIKWHIKAKGIQELSMMEQAGYVKRIFRHTNHTNEFIRNEAQCGLVDFYGFRGLRFLNVMVHPVSEWQQIQLLNKLNGSSPEDMTVIHNWLKSSNESVVIFALKLAAHYNCMQMYEDVIACLLIKGQQTRIHVIDYLKKLPREDTGGIIITDFHLQDKRTKLYILEALKEVGDTNQLAFLTNQLEDTDEELATAVLATLMTLNPSCTLISAPVISNAQKALVHKFNNEHAA